MSARLGLIAVLFLSGCASTGQNSHWWSPGTWFSHAPAGRVDRAEAKEEKAQAAVDNKSAQVVHAAHGEFYKEYLLLTALNGQLPSPYLIRFTENGINLLNQVDQVAAKEATDFRDLITDLTSGNAAKVAAAESKQLAAENKLGQLSDELTAARGERDKKQLALDSLNADLRKAFDRENALANKVRNFWAIIIGLVVLFVLGNLLSVAARFNPALGGISTAINGILTPGLAYIQSRARKGLNSVGSALAEIRQDMPEVASKITTIFDQHLDNDHKQIVKEGAVK